MDLICIMIEFLVMLISFRAGSINDKVDKIESILEDMVENMEEEE